VLGHRWLGVPARALCACAAALVLIRVPELFA
jgi:hypothetical protein